MTNDEIRELVIDRRYTDKQLAEALGVKVNSAAKRRQRAGVLRDASRVHYPRKTEAEIAEMGKLLDEGLSVKAVSEVLSVDWYTVSRHFPGRSWTSEQSAEHARTVQHSMKKIRKAWSK